MALRFTEQYVVDLECVFYGYHLDGAILKIAEAAYCLMPSLCSHKPAPLIQCGADSLFAPPGKNKSDYFKRGKLKSLVAVAATSVAVLAEISLRSPRKLFIFIIKKIIYRIKVSKK